MLLLKTHFYLFHLPKYWYRTSCFGECQINIGTTCKKFTKSCLHKSRWKLFIFIWYFEWFSTVEIHLNLCTKVIEIRQKWQNQYLLNLCKKKYFQCNVKKKFCKIIFFAKNYINCSSNKSQKSFLQNSIIFWIGFFCT